MTIQDKINLLKNRFAILSSRGDKNVKSPGVKNKIGRKIKKLEAQKR